MISVINYVAINTSTTIQSIFATFLIRYAVRLFYLLNIDGCVKLGVKKQKNIHISVN